MNCRILYLVGALRAGGLERQLYFLLKGMDRKHYQPKVVVWDFCEDDVYMPQIRKLGVALHSFSGTPSGAAKVKALRHLVTQIRPEVVHSYSFYTNFAAWWATLGTRAIAIGAVRSDFIGDKECSGPCLGRLSAHLPRAQIFNSFTAAETARNCRSPFVPKQLFVVRNGLDLHLFRSVPPSGYGRVCILGIGSLLPIKRWDRLLQASLGLKNNGFDFLVQIAGDGPLRRSLEQQAQDLGVANCVKFIGYAAHVPDLLANATFLTHTSDTEGCPNVVMEAMACGRAVVATNVGDIPYLVENGKTGFVVPRENEELLAERMAALITDRDMSWRMGKAGRAKAEQEFGLDRLVSETLAVYRALGCSS